MDFRVGGRWRYVIAGPNGSDLSFQGTYVDIVDGLKIVYTEILEGPGGSSGDESAAPVNTVTFEASGTGTHLSLLVQTDSRDLRDVILNSGMEVGMQGQMDRIEEVATGLLSD